MGTKADLRRMILTHLRVIDPEDSPTAGQAARLDLWIDGTRALLLEKTLCWWDADDIPEAVSIPLSVYVASRCCKAFGKAGKGHEEERDPAYAEIAGLKSSAQREEQRAEYF